MKKVLIKKEECVSPNLVPRLFPLSGEERAWELGSVSPILPICKSRISSLIAMERMIKHGRHRNRHNSYVQLDVKSNAFVSVPLQVRKGKGSLSPFLARFCGARIPDVISVFGDSLYFRLHATSRNTGVRNIRRRDASQEQPRWKFALRYKTSGMLYFFHRIV